MSKVVDVQAVEITELKNDFFTIMEEICIEDMDEEALAEYWLRHQEDDGTGEE